MMATCRSGWADPSGVAELPRVRQLSPANPSTLSSVASSRTSRAMIPGRRTINWSVPWSAGDVRTSARPASSSASVRCFKRHLSPISEVYCWSDAATTLNDKPLRRGEGLLCYSGFGCLRIFAASIPPTISACNTCSRSVSSLTRHAPSCSWYSPACPTATGRRPILAAASDH